MNPWAIVPGGVAVVFWTLVIGGAAAVVKDPGEFDTDSFWGWTLSFTLALICTAWCWDLLRG